MNSHKVFRLIKDAFASAFRQWRNQKQSKQPENNRTIVRFRSLT